MSAPRILSKTSATSAGTSITIGVPSGTVEGELLFVVVGNDTRQTITANEAGWTETPGVDQELFWDVGPQDGQLHTFQRPATGSEPATYQFNGGAFDEMIGFMYRIGEMERDSPVNVLVDLNDQGADPIIIPAVTTTADDCLLFALCGGWEIGATVPPAGYVEEHDIENGSIVIGVASKAAAAAGVYGPENYDVDNGEANAGRHLAIAPGVTVNPVVVERDLSGTQEIVRDVSGTDEVERDLSGSESVVVPFDKAHLV